MHPAVSTVAENVLESHHVVLPLGFLIAALPTNIGAPIQHSLLITTASWVLLLIVTTCKAGWRPAGRISSKRLAGWMAGAFLALSQICDRAARDREGTWSMKAWLPLLIFLIPENGLLTVSAALPSYSTSDETSSESSAEKRSHPRSFRFIAMSTVCAVAALWTPFVTAPTSMLGLSSTIFGAVGLVFFEGAIRSWKEDSHTGRRGFVSANGTFSRSHGVEGKEPNPSIGALRDVGAVLAIACGIATYCIEPSLHWSTVQYPHLGQLMLPMILLKALENFLIFVMLVKQGSLLTSFTLLCSCICSRLIWRFWFSSLWFAAIFAFAAAALLSASASSSSPELRSSLRSGRILFWITVLSLMVFALNVLFTSSHRPIFFTNTAAIPFEKSPLDAHLAPAPIDLKKGHPAEQLIQSAGAEFQHLLDSQSKSLNEAVEEYKRRNRLPPPPHFDKWYEFAVRSGVQLIDEFDAINQALLPFWGLKPSTIRARARLALGYKDNALIGLAIREGSVTKVEHGDKWQQDATVGMMKEFVRYLPDMDLAFNIHDEPRVVVPHDQLSSLISRAKDEALPAAMKNPSPRNQFSARPQDLNDGSRFEEAKVTRFNRFAHQQTWTHSRNSCSPNSQARNYEEEPLDNMTSYSTGALGFVYNVTAFSDICNSPSLSYRFGFFERPNAFNIIHELTPIFSQSKVSSFQDILYPSPWYWSGKVGYDEWHDTTWENKTNALYWRGSTTGGFSRDGGWRRQHRQHMVKILNAPDKAKILTDKGTHEKPEFQVSNVPRADFKSLMDVHFSHVGQCDEADCKAQKEFFDVTERVDGQDAWYFKHLLDLDGNAFSGRFYAFLRSRSLTYKMAVFREWHTEWLRPWVHYVPVSLIGDEVLELVRWFGGIGDAKEWEEKGGNGESVGERRAREIALRSTEWSKKVLRNVDFEVWFFRLLLEYGRVIDDNREQIGYAGP